MMIILNIIILLYYLGSNISRRFLAFSATAEIFWENETSNKIPLKEKEIDVRRMEVLATSPNITLS